MKAVARPLILATLSIFASMGIEGCRGVPFFGRRANEQGAGPGTTTVTTTTVTRTTRTTPTSDVTAPGRPEATPPPARSGRVIGTNAAVATPSPTPKVARDEKTRKKSKTSSKAASSTQGEFPTAKLVPGKPGYVFSPFDPKGRYVDVSGYTPGSKVKDPWTDKIFIVP